MTGRLLARALSVLTAGWMLTAGWVLSAGCTGTETGNPGFEPPMLDPAGIAYDPSPVITDEVLFAAAPGTVEPPEGEVEGLSLDDTGHPVREPVSPDGSFEIAVPGPPGGVFRFEVVIAQGRSAPVDLTGQVELRPVERPYEGCLLLDPGLQVRFPSAGRAETITVRNECPETLQLAAPGLRRASTVFEVLEPLDPFVLEAGAEQEVRVRAGDALEPRAGTSEVLFIQVTSPMRDRRPVTLYGVAP